MTNHLTKTSDNQPSIRQACEFLSDYAVLLFGSGATCVRMEKNIYRMARSFGYTAEFSILPRHIHLTVQSPDEAFTSVIAQREYPISFERIASLSKLSWQLADNEIDYPCAVRCLSNISREHCMDPWFLLLLVSLANAAFCRLFGGDAVAMAMVFAATAAGFMLKQMLTERRWDFRIVIFTSALVSAVIASTDGLFGLGATPGIAVGTSVLYLVPGIPFINSFCDFLDRHYLCAFGRMMNAVVILCCLSLGLCAGMMLMNISMF